MLLIYLQKCHNLSIKKCFTEEILEKLAEASALHYDMLTGNPTLLKLSNGLLIKKFIENMKDAKGRQIFLYSGHDVNITGVSKAHKFDIPKKLPDFGATLILEKYKDANQEIYVKVIIYFC